MTTSVAQTRTRQATTRRGTRTTITKTAKKRNKKNSRDDESNKKQHKKNVNNDSDMSDIADQIMNVIKTQSLCKVEAFSKVFYYESLLSSLPLGNANEDLKILMPTRGRLTGDRRKKFKNNTK